MRLSPMARRCFLRAASALLALCLAAIPALADDKYADNKALPAELTSGAGAIERSGEPAPEEADWMGAAGRGVIGLVIVAAVAVAGIWWIRRNPSMRRYFGGSGVMKVLSRLYLGSRTQVLLLKVGDRLLVVGTGPEGMRTLGEINNPDEVSRLVAEVEGNKDDSSKATFREALKETLTAAEKATLPRRAVETPVPGGPGTKRLAEIRAELERLAAGRGEAP